MPQKKHFQSLCRMAKQADPADFLSIVYAKNDDRDRHLRLVAPTKRAFGYTHQKNAQQPGTRCKCGNSSINLIMPITYVPLAGMAKLADAADLKSADPKGLWGFKSPSRHQLSSVFAIGLVDFGIRPVRL